MIKKDTVIEFTQDVIDLFDKSKSMLNGEQFVFTSKLSKKGSSALIASLKNLKTGSEHDIFWIFIKTRIKIISTFEENIKVTNFSPSDISLNENEEYVIVHKNEPELFYKSAFYNGYHNKTTDEVYEGSAIFTKKKGSRKKIKNRQSLNAFLNGIAGARDWTIKENTPLEKIYHVSGFFANTEHYFQTSYSGDFINIAKKCFILHKYNKETKTLYSESIDFSIKDYIENIQRKLTDTFEYGEAVSHVVGMLRETNKIKEYPFIFSTKYNAMDYKNELKLYNLSVNNIPRDKDLLIECLIKESKQNKKDLFLYNKNGFAAIACRNQDMLDYFKNAYHNPKKIISVIETKQL